MLWAFGKPLSELVQDTEIGINGCFIELGETSLLRAFNPHSVPKLEGGNKLR